jgi:hypothetical protein
MAGIDPSERSDGAEPAVGADQSVAAQIDSIGNFYRGVVCKLHRSPERGRIRTANGREIPFQFQHVTMIGLRRRFTDLHEGMAVGYDVSWTAKGLRVSVIRIPEGSAHRRPPSHGQVSAEQHEPAHHLTDENSQDRDVK